MGPNSGWLGGTGESWERGPYYLDGLVPLAYLLDNAALKAKAQRYLEWTLRSQVSPGAAAEGITETLATVGAVPFSGKDPAVTLKV